MKINFFKKIFSWFRKDRDDKKDKLQQDVSPDKKEKIFSGKDKEVPKEIIPDKSERFQQNKGKVKGKPSRRPPLEKWDLSTFVVDAVSDKVRFHDLHLPDKLMHGIFDLGFKYCTDIQGEILPESLKGRDVTGQAQTGTGKSAAFLISIFTQLLKDPNNRKKISKGPRALILAPTRELVLQIEKDAFALSKYTPFKTVGVFGGLGYEKQKKALLSKSVDIVVATPGRLIDFLNKRIVRLDNIDFLVIDEADRMLDMGFIPDIRKIVNSTPNKSKRQTMFFSATLNAEVERYAGQWTKDAYRVEIDPGHVASDNITQIIYIVTADEKFPLLYNLIIGKSLDRVLIFTNRKDQAKYLSDKLNAIDIKSTLLSGDVRQQKRVKALEDFRSGRIRVLVATDVAARGLHVDDISHVVNYNFPQDPEHYIHRIGRTGRANSFGTSISFACEDDSFYIPAIEKILGNELKCEYPDEELLKATPKPKKKIQKTGKSSKPYQKRKNYSKSKYHKNSSTSKRGNQSHRPKKTTGKPPVKKHSPK